MSARLTARIIGAAAKFVAEPIGERLKTELVRREKYLRTEELDEEGDAFAKVIIKASRPKFWAARLSRKQFCSTTV